MKWVRIWLYIGLVMVFFQVMIGGITRLTGSGLSITKWEIVTGTLPPTSAAQWEQEFDLYKQTPQYDLINDGMSMSEFKFIYFWEYFHRLWARMMGFVFLIPFGIFAFKKMLSKTLMWDLAKVIGSAMLAAMFGWIMVASGLIDRPWVNAYKLSIHLSLGFLVFALLWWAILKTYPRLIINHPWHTQTRVISMVLLILVCIQIFFGGMMSGIKAGLFFPQWPDMAGHFVHPILMDGSSWTWDNMVAYDKNPFAPAIVQFLHRMTAYTLLILGIYFAYHIHKYYQDRLLRFGVWTFLGVLTLQAILGILTLINCIGYIPVFLGSVHQCTALILLGSILFLLYHIRAAKNSDVAK